ncbi:hypothetical protein ET475_04135 [Microbacterium protaetiae]|uniref:Uncharacterized protein n=1 Tax=Microbacterium protaetiae TaxID=2509458 RepID=A0A4P6ECB4_9MICO|nr:hypothetical protein [Microbacterium protaetiae]QAY59256.1 hypothetical protein ET475_04135 [Microbacterium protaetiae]
MTTMGERLHPRGLFGRIDGVEIPFLGTGRAGSFDVPVDWVTAKTADLPGRYRTSSLDGSAPLDSSARRVPRSDVSDLRQWDWFVLFEGEWFRVLNERGGKFLISTHWYSRAVADPRWSGDHHSGWDQWVDAEDAQIQAVSYPAGAKPAAPPRVRPGDMTFVRIGEACTRAASSVFWMGTGSSCSAVSGIGF